MEFKVEKSEGDDNGYCLVQFIKKGTDTVRHTLSRIWAEPDEEHPGRQEVRYWTHGVELVGVLARNRSKSEADRYMRKYMGLSSG